MILLKPYHRRSQLGHHAILKVTVMVSDNHLWYTEMSNDLVKHEVSCRFTLYFEGRHFFLPLCEVVYNDNDVFVLPSKKWVTRHVIYPPLGKGPYRGDGKQRSRMWPHFSCIDMT